MFDNGGDTFDCFPKTPDGTEENIKLSDGAFIFHLSQLLLKELNHQMLEKATRVLVMSQCGILEHQSWSVVAGCLYVERHLLKLTLS